MSDGRQEMTRTFAICMLAAACFLAGCIVFPHRTDLSPTILGEIPLQTGTSVRVAVSEKEKCQGATRDTTIDKDGRFVLEPLRE